MMFSSSRRIFIFVLRMLRSAHSNFGRHLVFGIGHPISLARDAKSYNIAYAEFDKLNIFAVSVAGLQSMCWRRDGRRDAYTWIDNENWKQQSAKRNTEKPNTISDISVVCVSITRSWIVDCRRWGAMEMSFWLEKIRRIDSGGDGVAMRWANCLFVIYRTYTIPFKIWSVSIRTAAAANATSVWIQFGRQFQSRSTIHESNRTRSDRVPK